uniref:uncharacterized protein LOC122605993 isoform X3 n=1 Tax=Erigeron canadensis TaxID=72917 RepID=UPI001CB94293|nr:uncharacterized protein LOC122605993 isoform X3 [Erigeron canadensis]XP_043634896.1 uncharacterized protein LOC122605993 isoform X3 [Erigeron canadensis]
MTTATTPLCQPLSVRPFYLLSTNTRFKYKLYNNNKKPHHCNNNNNSNRTSCPCPCSNFLRNNWRYSCFKDPQNSSFDPDIALPSESEPNQSNIVKHDLVSKLQQAVDAVFSAQRWTVPWTAKTILQVMLLWIASFWLVGSWIIPFLAHVSGFRKETLTYRGQALYSLLTDVAEGLAGIAILHRCLAPFRPLSSDWFKFTFKGKWHIDIGLGCLMFPLVNRLSQVNLNLMPMIPPAPVTVSNVEQSIVARDPMAMALYAIVVSVCAPIWEEVVFRGFLLPSLTSIRD